MESNKDEAIRCLHISQKHRATGNLSAARKFVQKSLSLFSTPEAVKLLELIETEASSTSSSASSAGSSTSSSASASTNPTSFTSATETHPSASGTKKRNAPSVAESTSTKEKREYTAENLAVVKRVRACKVTGYYEILAVKRDCDEADVKKAYRKVSRRFSRKHVVRLTFVQCPAGACATPRQKWCAGR
jgi:DnaJ family protein B protein 12